MNTQLLIIDPQNDFCSPTGELYVKHADMDMLQLATLIKENRSVFDKIHVTLDSHNLYNVAHPIFWKNKDGQHPNPFTIISKKDVETGVWIPDNFLQEKMVEYLTVLEHSGRYPLCIWPPHCIIGTWGNDVFPIVSVSLIRWEEQGRAVNYIIKGTNPYTEHYSAIQAEVPDPNDETTWINKSLLKTLEKADVLAIAGEASSHCVANTVRDILSYFHHEKKEIASKIILLWDAMSPVSGFENLQEEFFEEVQEQGVRVSTCLEFINQKL